MSNFKIEKVENRHLIQGDNFLMVNYYPYSDKITHIAFMSAEYVKKAISKYTVGKWNVKCMHDWKTNPKEQYQECKKCGEGHAL